ncbi:LuxR family transcriptional regulator [Legionella longbeachae]|uniref:LuxR family transcriptional regulator n=1 Tax=Legionella longbeachae TaxID=450 RepID=UPI0012473410|nr:LuxR family transcriptional regulator [Legionella longbeachae]QEY51611.1 LuxR family transcriptional regulator [Legionella longbeachae]
MNELRRIYILGHPAAGKAFFSKSLADTLGYQFIDADMGLEHKVGLSIKEILGQSGLEHYERTQESILDALSKRSGIVVGLDCYIGNTPKVREYLNNGCVIFLNTSVQTQIRRSGTCEPLIGDKYYEDLFSTLHADRDDYYNQISDFVLLADEGDVNKHIHLVINYLKKNEFNLAKPVALTDKELIYFKYNTDIPIRISEQQAICLKYLSKGKTAKEIGREMNISYRTVEVYIAQLKEKLGCDSSKELINIYLSNQ